GRSAGQLIVEEGRGGQSGGPNGFLRHCQAGALQSGGQVTRRENRVIRQHQERPLPFHQALQEFGGARQGVFFADEHAVHIGEPAFRGRAPGASLMAPIMGPRSPWDQTPSLCCVLYACAGSASVSASSLGGRGGCGFRKWLSPR